MKPEVIQMRKVDIASTRSETETVLEQVNWSVAPGDFWIIGSLPGAGKSALLQTVAGIQRPKGGEFLLFGQTVAGLREEELLRVRLRFSLVFEGGGRLFAQLTVAENIALPYCYHQNCTTDQAADRLQPVLELTELDRYARSLPTRVPRALCSRIGLARALITKPEVLLLDNPLHGLDERERAWWLGVLTRLAREPASLPAAPVAIAVATDDLKPWLDLGNRFALIKSRSLLDLGPRAALDSSQEPLLHDLLALGPAPG